MLEIDARRFGWRLEVCIWGAWPLGQPSDGRHLHGQAHRVVVERLHSGGTGLGRVHCAGCLRAGCGCGAGRRRGVRERRQSAVPFRTTS
jgi:hypothetical protein